MDPGGRLSAVNQPNYDRIDYQYNALGQKTQRITNGDATTQETWAFDQVGRLSQITNAQYNESYQYTKRGTLDKVTNHTLNQTIDYTDDLNGRRIGLATDLTQVSYQRDALGRIHTLTTQEDRFEFGYDKLNRMVTKTSTNGTRDVKLYNERGDIIAIAFQRPQTSKELKKGYQYGFDTQLFDDYKREHKTPNYADLYSFETHLYQVEQQLIAAYPENGYVLTDLIVYQWNEVDNLMAKYDASEKTQNSYFYDYDAADRLSQAFEGKYTTAYHWDANGNLETKTQKGKTFVYTYNEANQLTHAREWERDDEDDDDHDEDEFEWDDRVDTQYQYSRNGELTQTIATDDDNDQRTTQYNSDAYGRLIAIIGDNQDTLTFAYDSRDRRVLSAFQGWVREDDDDDDWDNDDYSASSIHTRTNNLIPYQYTGKYRESISGFNHMDARWYNPKVGRFIQPDQYNHVNLMLPKGAQSELMRYIGRTQNDLLKDPAQQMRYGYVSGNALRWVDPLGLCLTIQDLKESYDIYNLAKADWKQGIQDQQDPYVKMIDSFSNGEVGQGLWQATKNIAVEGLKGGLAYLGLRGSGLANTTDNFANIGLSNNGVKHLSKHLDEFKDIDESFTLMDQIRLGQSIASKPGNLVSTRNGSTSFKEVIEISGESLSVKSVLNASGNLRTVYIIKD